MKIGLVDLDTSHPENWVPIERELGYEVVCVWDGGDVHPSGYAAKFAAKHGIPTVCTSLAKMAERVDLAILNGCDWDKRIERSRPFVKAGKAILLDKPIAGHPKDLDQIAQWISQGVRITGGSSLRFAAETQAWLANQWKSEAKLTPCYAAVPRMNSTMGFTPTHTCWASWDRASSACGIWEITANGVYNSLGLMDEPALSSSGR